MRRSKKKERTKYTNEKEHMRKSERTGKSGGERMMKNERERQKRNRTNEKKVLGKIKGKIQWRERTTLKHMRKTEREIMNNKNKPKRLN